jgi:hypothetical protein
MDRVRPGARRERTEGPLERREAARRQGGDDGEGSGASLRRRPQVTAEASRALGISQQAGSKLLLAGPRAEPAKL